MRATFGALMSLFFGLAASAAWAGEEPKTYPLYPEGVPGALGKETGVEFHSGDVPTFTVYRPEEGKANGASVVICPGGGVRLPRDRARGERGRPMAELARHHGGHAQV